MLEEFNPLTWISGGQFGEVRRGDGTYWELGHAQTPCLQTRGNGCLQPSPPADTDQEDPASSLVSP